MFEFKIEKRKGETRLVDVDIVYWPNSSSEQRIELLLKTGSETQALERDLDQMLFLIKQINKG